MAEDYRAMAEAAARKHGIDPILFGKVVGTESNYNPKAVSPKGAAGLGQLMPATAKEMGVIDIHDPVQNLEGSAKYLAIQLKAHNGDVPLALASYNAGPGAVKKYGGVPPFKETQDYIAKITGAPAPKGTAKAPAGPTVKPIVDQYAVRRAEQVAQPERVDYSGLETERWNLEILNETQPSFLAMVGAGVRGATTARIYDGLKKTMFSEAYEPEEGYVPNTAMPQAQADPELFNKLLSTRSTREASDIVARWEDDQVRSKALHSQGGGVGLAIGLGAEVLDFANILPGVAVHKVMVAKNLAATAAGVANASTKGQMIGREIVGNLMAGTTIEATAQALNQEFRPVDLFLSAAMDIGVGTVLGNASANVIRDATMKQAAFKAAVEQELRHTEMAQAKLGPDASMAELAAEVKRSMTAEAAAPVIENTTSAVSAKRKFFESPDDVAAKAEAPQGDMAKAPVEIEAGAASWGPFMSKTGMAERRALFANSDGVTLRDMTGGSISTVDQLEAMPPGVKFTDQVPKEAHKAIKAAQSIAARFLGDDFRMVVHSKDMGDSRAAVIQVSDKAALVALNKNLSEVAAIRSVTHEIGHMVINKNLAKLDDAMLTKLDASYKRLVKEQLKGELEGSATRGQRYSLLNPELMPAREFPLPLGRDKYSMSRDEFAAEQFVKYMEEDWATVNKTAMPTDVIAVLKNAIKKALEFLRLAKRENIGVTDEYRELFDMLTEGPLPDATAVRKAGDGPTVQADAVSDILTDPYAKKIGVDNLPLGTDYERAIAKETIALHKKADEWALANPKDAAWDARAQNIADNNIFNVASTGLIMLKSESNLMRMLASELVEDASGVAGKKQATAAISKYLHERLIMGNAINDLTGAYEGWAKATGVPAHDMVWGGKGYDKFNREVFAEREARAQGTTRTQDGYVKAAADSLDAAYERSAKAQKANKTLGWASLPESSKGYTPHQMSAKAVLSLNNEQRSILQSALTDQYVELSGWDIGFADQLAAKVVQRMRDRASGGFVHQVGGSGGGSVEIVEDALRSMGMTAPEVRAAMEKYTRGAAKHTKKRIELDLNREYPTEAGPFKLLDVFETDQISLLRNQTERVSGEVALARHGIYGKPHLETMRKALAMGEDGKVATPKELEAFDQICAEFLGQPFGTVMGKWLDGAVTANTLVRMGGAVFNQMGEFINSIFHVGAARTLDAVTSIGRLRSEILAKARGETIENSWLDSIELTGGGEFGTDAYKVVMPYDNPNHHLPAYGRDSTSTTTRILRAGAHYQSILSGWRLVHSAQQRGVAEQIVKKIAKYTRDGQNDIALQQFGISPELQAALRKDLDAVTGWDGAKETGFDVTKITDPDIREQVIQAVHRGTLQIIQGTFIGERGKWVHDGWMRALAQFRTFPITSMEKQWGRQRNSRGVASALGMIMGSMSLATPIYMARTYANSIGREDQEEYLEKNLQPINIARATMNYVAMSGMAGDFVGFTTSLLPDDWGVSPVQGRNGQSADFVGSYILPASSLVDDGYKLLQNLDDPAAWTKVAPFGRLPWLLPAMNATKD
jgi:hypothetical protein